MNECDVVWKSIPIFEGAYEASNDGRVRHAKTNRVLATTLNSTGYSRVFIRGRHRLLHKLVALAFLGEPPAGLQVNHKNGVKTDCSSKNLEYLTPTENREHAKKNGLVARPSFGERNGRSRLTTPMVIAIRYLRKEGVPVKVLAVAFGVSEGHIYDICCGEAWKHLAA